MPSKKTDKCSGARRPGVNGGGRNKRAVDESRSGQLSHSPISAIASTKPNGSRSAEKSGPTAVKSSAKGRSGSKSGVDVGWPNTTNSRAGNTKLGGNSKRPNDSLSGKGKAGMSGSSTKLSGNGKTSQSNKMTESALEKMTVNQLKPLLRQKGVPVSGRKAELISRLLNGYTGPKPKPWQHSQAKKDLKRALLDPTSPIHKMTVEEIRKSDDRYTKYPNFEKYYRDLKEHVEAEKEQVKQDDATAERHMANNPRSHLNKRGYPHWDTHAAKALLGVDVANGMHQKMKPLQLRNARSACTEFPADVFTKRVHREVSKQKGAEFWAHKRNKRGMKKYLKEVALRSNEV